MSHLEALIVEYLNWQGYLVRHNIKVGRLSHGGWAMELDIIAYNPNDNDLVHYEPSLDAHNWETREKRYEKKFTAAKTYLFAEVFSWLPSETPLRQIAIFPSRSIHRAEIAGGIIQSVDELVAEIRSKIKDMGVARKSAISENYPLLRTLQLSHCGYNRAINP